MENKAKRTILQRVVNGKSVLWWFLTFPGLRDESFLKAKGAKHARSQGEFVSKHSLRVQRRLLLNKDACPKFRDALPAKEKPQVFAGCCRFCWATSLSGKTWNLIIQRNLPLESLAVAAERFAFTFIHVKNR